MRYGIETLEFKNGDAVRIPITSSEPYPKSFLKGYYGLPDISIEWFRSKEDAEDYLKTGKKHIDPPKCCGECRYHRCVAGDWLCVSKKSVYSGQYTEYGDLCEEGEKR